MKLLEWVKGLFVTEKIRKEAESVIEDVVDEIKSKAKVKKIHDKVRKRARDAKGRFLKDDPDTEKNEAYE